MSEQEHKNRGFLKDKLGNYQVDPPEQVWDAISGQIGHGRKRRGMYILLLATAASIALAVSLGILFLGPDLSQEQSSVDLEGLEEAAPESPVTEAGLPEAQERTQVLALQETLEVEGADQELPGNVPARIREQQAISDIEAADEIEAVSDQDEYGEREAREEIAVIEDMETVRDPDPELIPDTAIKINEEPFPLIEPEKKRNSRWMVGAAVSPMYSYRDAEAAAIPSDQAESGLLSYSTGIHVRYRRNSRLAFETGIYYNRTGIAIGAPGIRIFSQQQDNMLFGVGSESADINTVSNSVGNIVAYSGDIYLNGYKITSENANAALQSEILTDVRVAESGIQQHLDFLELPFNLRYSVIDRDFELQLVGGLSTNFLVGNSVTIEGESGREEIGYLTNVNTINYSGSAGLGMIYHMGRKMSLFLEPRFRYFLNSVNDESLPATRPYSLGLYTGLSYTF